MEENNMSSMEMCNNSNNGVANGFAIAGRKDIKIINRMEYNGVTAEIMEYEDLKGANVPSYAEMIYFMEKKNMRVRQIALHINNDSVKIEAGAMSYFQGPLEMVSGLTMGNVLGKMVKSSLTGETASQPVYKGSGLLVLEPSFRFFIPFILNPGETVIVDKGMFYVASESVKVEPAIQKSVSSGLLGNEGWFQIALTGPGMVILESPVPMSEIAIINLNNDVLKVDGNFAVLRTAGIQFTVERSAKTLVGSAASGEGLVNVMRGTGQVWLAPTIRAYQLFGLNK